MQKNLLLKKTIDPPPEIQQLARQNELGELHKVYTIVRSNTAIFGIGMILIVFGALFAFAGIGMMLSIAFPPTEPPSMPPPSVPSLSAALSISGLSLVFLISGLCMTLVQSFYTRWHVYLWQYGFIYEKKRTREVFRWNQIESVERRVHPYSLITIVVRRQDGYKVTLGNVFADISELMDVVLEESTHQLAVPEFIITPPPGSTRTFALHKIDRVGISNAQETLTWEEIQEFTTKDGVITVLKKPN